MFRLLRSHMKKILLGTILLIVPPFVIWGVNSSDSDDKGNLAAGKIYGKRVTVGEFLQARDTCMLNLYLVYGPDFRDLLGLVDINRQAWDRLLFLAKAQREGVVISDQEVISQIERFFSKDGVFDAARYGAFLERAGIPAVVFEDRIRGTLAVGRISRMVTDTALITWPQVQDAYRAQTEKAQAGVVALKLNDYLKQAKSDEKQARGYFEQNAEEFRLPEKVRLRYALFAPETQGKSVDAKEKAMEAAFEKATDVSMRLYDEPDLQKAAKRAGVEVIVTDFFAANNEAMPLPSREIARLAFAMEAGKNSPVLRTPKGFVIMNVLEKQPSRLPAYEEVKDKARDKAARLSAREKMRQDAEKIRERLAQALTSGKGTFRDLAKGLGLKVLDTGSFTRAEALESLPGASAFREACFETPVGALTGVFPYDDGMLFGLVEKHVPGTLEGFEKEKQALWTQLLNREKEAVLEAWFETVKQDARFQDLTPQIPDLP